MAKWSRDTTRKEKTAYKLVLLGDYAVGKTSLTRRLLTNEFDPSIESTVGCNFFARTVQVNGTRVKFQIWDTAGQEKFKSLIPVYYHGADAAVIVYDVTREESYKTAKKWVMELESSRDVILALVGNKSDLTSEREVDYDTASGFATGRELPFIETSALTSGDINDILVDIAEKITYKLGGGINDSKCPSTNVVLDDDDEENPKCGSCCR